MVQVAHGVDGLLGREVVGIGGAAPGRLAGMDLDQQPPEEHPHQLAGRRATSTWGPIRLPGNRVQGLGHLDVVVAVHLGAWRRSGRS